MKKILFLGFTFLVFVSAVFAQKPPAKKPVAPAAKKESATTDKKSKPPVKKENASPSAKKTVAPSDKKSTATVKKEIKKELSATAKKASSSTQKETKKEAAATVKKSLPTVKKEIQKETDSASKIPAPSIGKTAAKTTTIAEIPAADWKILTDALQSEQWTKADALADGYLKKLSVENGEKQLAQLRYFRLYALAGEIAALHEAKSETENAAWMRLDKTISEFNGAEIILPPHEFLADCRESVNFVCPVKTDDHALRVTATNKEGTAIHSFNYVSFDDKIVFNNFDGGKIFLGGKLRRAEFNQDLSKPWIMRLFFDDGFITRADVK